MRTKRTYGQTARTDERTNATLVTGRRAEGELENVRGAARASCALFPPPPTVKTRTQLCAESALSLHSLGPPATRYVHRHTAGGDPVMCVVERSARARRDVTYGRQPNARHRTVAPQAGDHHNYVSATTAAAVTRAANDVLFTFLFIASLTFSFRSSLFFFFF